jgi:hypothetical protein
MKNISIIRVELDVNSRKFVTGSRGEDIGPKRVWLSHQDVPGLAMSRSVQCS